MSSDFLREILGEGGGLPKAEKKHTVKADKWDRQDLEAVLKELPEFAESDEKLASFVDTGHHAFGDEFFSLARAIVEGENPEEIMPLFRVNQHINEEARKLKEQEELRQYTVGDPVAAALADISMEPTLETLFDKHKEEQKLAEQLQEMYEQMQGLADEAADLDGMMQAAQGEGKGQEGKARGPVDYQKQMEKIQEQMEKLREKMEQKAKELQDGLDKKRPGTQQALRQALKEATDEAESVESSALMWGQDPGSVHHMDAKTRLEFAKRVNTPKFRRIAKLIGPLTRLALAENARKTEYGREELHDITLGSDLTRVLPTELLALDDEQMTVDFYRRWTENQLLQYELRGVERVARGGIIFCEDGSGSMGGDREIWAKAVGGALLHIAKKQKRSFYGIHFGGPGMIQCFDFRDPTKVSPDKVMEFMELFFGGGTDFMTPLSHALDLLREEFEAYGAVKGDIVFVTDGQCGVTPEWLDKFCEERQRLGFRVWGVNIGGHPQDEPMATICEHRVATVHDLVSGNDVREIFRGV